jgi:hypothetical protein
MGFEADRLPDQIQGSLSGAEHELEVAERVLQEAEVARDRCVESVRELREILARHTKGRRLRDGDRMGFPAAQLR